MSIILFVFFIVTVVVGVIFGYFLSIKSQSYLKQQLKKLEDEIQQQILQIGDLKEKNTNSEKEYIQLSTDYKYKVEQIEKLSKTKEEYEQRITDLQKSMKLEFKTLSQEIFSQKTNEFKKDSKEQLESMLNPLKEQIKSFQEKATHRYEEETKEIFSLKNEVKKLNQMNVQMNQEAKNLTQALKGNVKTQGAWGELVLNQVLEASGLREGEEYVVQGKDMGLQSELNSVLKPDVVIRLPQKKHLVIDSKVSLTHYLKYVESDQELDRAEALKSFIESIKKHINSLESKNYQTAYGLQSVDFVFLFFPIESAFSVALQESPSITNDSWKKSIVIVSPTTLLATLRTVHFIWQREREQRNANAIAQSAGSLYDKFVGFVSDLQKVEKGLKQSQDSYDEAYKKLTTGKGNIISNIENIKKLGARAKKDIQSLVKT